MTTEQVNRKEIFSFYSRILKYGWHITEFKRINGIYLDYPIIQFRVKSNHCKSFIYSYFPRRTDLEPK